MKAAAIAVWAAVAIKASKADDEDWAGFLGSLSPKAGPDRPSPRGDCDFLDELESKEHAKGVYDAAGRGQMDSIGKGRNNAGKALKDFLGKATSPHVLSRPGT